MGAVAIRGGKVVTPNAVLDPGLVVFDEGRLTYVGSALNAIPERAVLVNADGKWVLPGLIDTHVHGSYGDDVMLSGAEGIRRISQRFVEFGTTAWLPSTIAARHEELIRAVGWCVEAAPGDEDGARVVGIHVEGPYINLKRKGAQPAEGVRDPDLAEMAELLSAGSGLIRLVTLAPELPGGLELIRFLVTRGVIASLGHSDATYEQAMEAIASGATHATHLFNAMPPIHHRSPGLITACLDSPEIIAELIPDGVHLSPHILRMAFRLKGRDRSAIITDAFSATGLPDGEHRLGPHRVYVDGNVCKLDDGTIAGSILTMDRALANVVEFARASVVDAVRVSSQIPAQIAGCGNTKGSLQVGKDADLWLADNKFRCRATWVSGRRVFGHA